MTKPNWRKGGKTSAPPPKPSVPASESQLALNNSLKTPITAQFKEEESYSTNPRESTACVFYEVCVDFAEACEEVWPMDEALKSAHSKLKSCVSNPLTFQSKTEEGEKLAKSFHENFLGSYGLITSKDPSFFAQDHELLLSVNAQSKFENSSKEVKDTIWEYLKSLVQYAGMVDMYSKCPQAMIDSISGVAGGLISKLQSGELDASSLNPLQLGQMMMQEMSAADLEGFGNAIMDGGNMESMMSIMQSTMSSLGNGGSMPGMMPGMGGMPDLAAFSSMFKN